VLGQPKEPPELRRDLLDGAAVIGSAMLGVVVLYLITGLLLSVHLAS
jgi:hypothetical protein